MAQYAIHAVGLRKQFGDTVAVDGVDLTVPEGGIYGFLGPNGAGKTTTIRMLATLVRPTAGQATVFGYDLVANTDEVRARISLTGQYASVDEDLTGMENLAMMGRLLGHGRRAAADRARELLSAFGLEAAADRQAKRYSGGMRRRLDIAASIVVTPALLFLDEPTTGLDPRSRSRVWDVVRALTDNGTTVLLTTQYLEEADRLADRLAVIDHGRIIAEGTTAQLKESVGAGAVRVRLRDPDRRADAERLLERVLAVPVHREEDPAALSARLTDTGRAGAALSELARVGIEVGDFGIGQSSLDEVFFALTGQHTKTEAPEEIPA
ncbi:Daunorubicin/doxorubicin resistance ATP-binding protein DrrA [Nocardia otitidiscaviarum]|uniref:Daunorubicin/doxorubicin resistance ATP-binding protein DrrA n=1 Tax=Nocardia otitidiscaviarum TaxID=1823 RepID=A0A378YBA9_9NOCA|nr:daunorubicin resistance protein DrrA family ABC transporter ATP-binding protein [Nocardia otitidiscaviarum]SUA73649.1 Daunorubicin/doxorubicin resistance ATP-binding protein DrrA [Nocardia otitidiscaviarum]